MELSVSSIVLTAKRRQIEELRRLATRAALVAEIGRYVHALQAERGASSLYLASAGGRFGDQRVALTAESEAAEQSLRARIEAQLAEPGFGSATLCSLIAWVVLGMEALPALRQQVATREISADEVVMAFSRLVAGLLSLIVDVADSAVDPGISRQLVALFNLVQGKELVGQERAVGAILFASGRVSAPHQQRLMNLIDAQERNFQLFSEFAPEHLVEAWQAQQLAPFMAPVERYRRVLCTTAVDGTLDVNVSDAWFACNTERLAGLRTLQEDLVTGLQTRCAELIAEAEHDLSDAKGLLDSVQRHPPESAELVRRFLNAEALPEDWSGHLAGQTGGSEHSLLQVLRNQTERLATIERELGAAKRALQERKTIERAKGMLMARFNMSEDEAYKSLRKTSMEQNRRLADVAEATISVLAVISDKRV